VTFTATLAFFFFVINLSKWLPYAWLGLLDMRNMFTSLVLLPLILAYTAYAYWVFRGKVTLGEGYH